MCKGLRFMGDNRLNHFVMLMDGSDRLGCTDTVIRYPDGVIEVDSFIFKDGNRYNKSKFKNIQDNWEKYFDEKPSINEIFGQMEPEGFDPDYEPEYMFEPESLIDGLAQGADFSLCRETKFEFDGCKINICRYYHQPYVNAYEESRAYGGPEEGGWYYTEGRPIASIPVFSKKDEEHVKKMIKGLRYRCRGNTKNFKVRTGCGEAHHYPIEKPRYS